jgi:hypothetical protein
MGGHWGYKCKGNDTENTLRVIHSVHFPFLIVRLAKKFPTFYRIPKFNIQYTRANHWSVSSTEWTPSTPPHTTYLPRNIYRTGTLRKANSFLLNFTLGITLWVESIFRKWLTVTRTVQCLFYYNTGCIIIIKRHYTIVVAVIRFLNIVPCYLVKMFPEFDRTLRSITILTIARHWPLSSTRWIQSKSRILFLLNPLKYYPPTSV